jgi:UDP-glucuronate decarboxylase
MESSPDITGPCNLGNPREICVNDIALMVLDQTRSRSRIERRPLPQDDPKRRQPVIDRARSLLGWNPSVPLEEGLRATIDYFTLKMVSPLDCPLGHPQMRVAKPGNASMQRARASKPIRDLVQ